MYIKRFLFCIVLFALCSTSVFAQDSEEFEGETPPIPLLESSERYIPKYEAGQGSLSLGVGVFVPLFFQKFTGEYITKTNLSLGTSAWLEWDIYLWKALSVGMEINGSFLLSPNNRFLLFAPISVHVKYTFQIYPIEFPVSFALGVNLITFGDNFKIDFILKPKVGVTYRINQNWAVGVFTSYLFDIQTYNYSLGSEYSRLGNFLDASVGFSYVF